MRRTAPKLGGVRALLVAAGYNVSHSHVDPQAIKTDAPVGLLWDLLRIWADRQPASKHSATSRVAAELRARGVLVSFS